MINKEDLAAIVKDINTGSLYDAKQKFSEAVHDYTMDAIATRHTELSKPLATTPEKK